MAWVDQFKENVGNVDAGMRGVAATALASMLMVGTFAGLVALVLLLGWPGGIIVAARVTAGLGYAGSRGR